MIKQIYTQKIVPKPSYRVMSEIDLVPSLEPIRTPLNTFKSHVLHEVQIKSYF